MGGEKFSLASVSMCSSLFIGIPLIVSLDLSCVVIRLITHHSLLYRDSVVACICDRERERERVV